METIFLSPLFFPHHFALHLSSLFFPGTTSSAPHLIFPGGNPKSFEEIHPFCDAPFPRNIGPKKLKETPV